MNSAKDARREYKYENIKTTRSNPLQSQNLIKSICQKKKKGEISQIFCNYKLTINEY